MRFCVVSWTSQNMPMARPSPMPFLWVLSKATKCEGHEVDKTPCAGARKTHLVRTGDSSGTAASALELAAAAATDLSTYWSNSVRPYALRGSPFLRPPVFASLTRLSAEFEPTTGLSQKSFDF